jgi:hypothetical protein
MQNSNKASKDPLVDPVELGQKAVAAFKEWVDRRKCIKLERFTGPESTSLDGLRHPNLFSEIGKLRRVSGSLVERGADKALIAATGVAASVLSELLEVKTGAQELASKIGLAATKKEATFSLALLRHSARKLLPLEKRRGVT